MNSPAGILLENRVGWGGIIASLSAARCNCSLNNNLSGVATLPFSTGLHSVLSLSETGPTRTVAFPCLPGQLQHPPHQGWLLETFFSQRYIHLMWSRPVPCTLTHRGKLFMSAGETVEKHQSSKQWGFCCTNQLITTYAHHSVTYGYTYTIGPWSATSCCQTMNEASLCLPST